MRFKYFHITIYTFLLITCTNAQDMKPKHILLEKIMPSEYGQAILFYTNKAKKGQTVIEILENSTVIMTNYIRTIPNQKITYRYASGKWTVGEVLQHIITYEQIMTERALVVAGLDLENLNFSYYSQSSTVYGANGKTKDQLLSEFISVREKTIQAFKSLTNEQLKTVGTLDGNRASVRMIGLCISGHQSHHFNVLRERYRIL